MRYKRNSLRAKSFSSTLVRLAIEPTSLEAGRMGSNHSAIGTFLLYFYLVQLTLLMSCKPEDLEVEGNFECI